MHLTDFAWKLGHSPLYFVEQRDEVGRSILIHAEILKTLSLELLTFVPPLHFLMPRRSAAARRPAVGDIESPEAVSQR